MFCLGLRLRLLMVLIYFSAVTSVSNAYGAVPNLITPIPTNIGANSATLILQSSATGTGYFTLLPGSNATCGSGSQTKAGQDSLGNPAFRIGSLPLVADTPSYYTVRNLTQSTPYTVCFTSEDSGLNLQPMAANINMSTTAAAATPAIAAWSGVGSAGFGSTTSLAFAPDGTPYLAYSEIGNGYKATVMRYSGGAWELVGSAGFSAGSASYISLAFAPDGTPYIAYYDGAYSGKATVMKYSGGVWSQVGTAGFSSGSASYVSLAFAPDGTPHVAYKDSGNSSKCTVMKYSGGVWSQVGNAGFSSGQASYTSLAFAPDGSPYVAYMDSINRGTVMKYSSGAWRLEGSAGFSTGTVYYTSLAFAPDGTPYVAYSDNNTSNKATVKKYILGGWILVGSAGFSAGQANTTSLAFAPDGTPYVAYSDSSNSARATVMKFSGGAWGGVGIAGFSASTTNTTSIAFAPDGTPYVAYGDNGSSRATVMRYTTATTVNAITPLTPAGLITNAATVTFRTTFADPVSGVTASNFYLLPTITGAGITGVSAVGTPPTTQWDVTVATGSAEGSLGLRLTNSLGISPGIATLLPFAGQTYSIDRTTPAVSIGAPTASRVLANAADYVVTYTDPNFSVSTLTAADVTLNATGTANGTISISGTGSPRLVTISSITGSGTLGISLAAGTATDLADNTAPAAGPSVTFSVPLSAPPALTTPTITNVGANSATLILQSNATGTGYFTLLPGSSATCGSGHQTKAGQDSLGNPAFRIGSLPLMDNTPAYYTVRNLTQSTPYTVCFTAEDNSLDLQPAAVTTSLTTLAAATPAAPAWNPVGTAGFSAAQTSYDSLAFAPDGAPYVAYSDYASSWKATVMKFNGSAWTVVGSAGFSAGQASFTSLAIAPDGTPYVAYSDVGNGSKATVMKYSGGVWSAVGSPGFTATTSSYLSLAFAPDGTPYVAYQDSNGKAAVMSYSGGGWSLVGNANITAGIASYISLVFAPDGTPYVAYSDSYTAFVQKYSGGVWSLVGSAGFSTGAAYYTSLAFAPDGTPYLGYKDNGNSQKATVMKYNGSTWTLVGSAGFSVGTAYFTSLAFAPDGSPYIAYADDGNSQKATVMKYINGVWNAVGSTGFSAGSVGYITLAFTPDGTPFVAYSDNTGKATVMRYSTATTVISSNRLTPPISATNATTVTFRVTFADPVSGVTAVNFDLSPTVTGAAITSVSAVGTVPTTQWDVTVASGSAEGSLGLRLTNSLGISPGIATSLPYAGQRYNIDRTSPTVSIGPPAASRVLANAVDYTVTCTNYDFAASTLAAADVILNATGTASGTVSISGTGISRIVTISNIIGSGTLGISLAAGTVTDSAGNGAPVAGPSTTFSVPLLTPPTLATPTVTNVGANSTTLVLQSSATGTGYFTLLPGSNATCGSGPQTKAGQDSLGNQAYRIGSLPLVAGTPGYYTVRNLVQNTPYTVCFTAEDSAFALQPIAVTTNLNTALAASPAVPAWNPVGSAGFSAGSANYTSLAFAPDGTPYVLYKDGGNGSKATVMKYSGGAWNLVGNAGFSAGTVSYTSLAFAPDGTPYVAYSDSAKSYKATVMKYSGGVWSEVGNAAVYSGDIGYNSLAFAPDGTPYLAYEDYASSSHQVRVKKYSDGVWSVQGGELENGKTYYPSLAFGPDGTPYVAYQDYGNSQKAKVKKFEASAWTVVGDVGISAGQANNIFLAFAPDGTPYLSYQDVSNGSKSTVMQYSGGAWSVVGSAGFSVGAVQYPSLAFGPDGIPYVAYQDADNSSKATVMKYSGGAWNVVGSAGFSAGQPSYTSLAFAPDGIPYVAYQDGGNSAKATVMRYTTATTVISSNRLTPELPVTTAATVTFRITFADPVSGVTAANFDLLPTVTGAAITGVSAVGAVPTAQWDVTVATGSADGYLGLRLANSSGISSSIATPLPYSGQSYTIDRTTPTVSIGVPAASQVLANSVDYSVTYMDPNFATSTLSVPDITLNATGTASGTVLISGTGNSRIITIGSITGSGTLGISLAAGTAADLAGNTAPAAGPSATFSATLSAPPTLTTPTATNVGANSATLVLQSSVTGTGYFTLLPGSSATCGSGPQTKAGQDNLGNPAFRIGSLPLTANTPRYYTVRNLTQSAPYTVCFTAEDSGLDLQPIALTTNLSTMAAASPVGPAWRPIGTAGFTPSTTTMTLLAFAPDGTPYVAYQDYANSNKVTVVKYSGGGWSLVGSAGFSSASAYSISLAFAPDGSPYVAYQDSGNSSKATVMKYSGGAWNAVGSAGFSAGQASYNSLAFAPDGTPYLAYRDGGNSSKATVMKYSGGVWSLVGSAGFSAGQASYTSLAFAPDGTPYVAYQDVGNGSKVTVMKYSSGAWNIVGSAGFSTGQTDYNSLAFAPDGTLYVAYRDSSNSSKATVMKYSSEAWTNVGSAGFSAGSASYTSLAFAPDGTPHVAYMDGGNSSKATVMKYSGGAWTNIVSTGFSAGSASYTSLAFATDGTPYVAYVDGGNSSKATVMKLVEAAPSPATNAATNISAIGATLNGTVNDNGAATTVTFDYGLDTSYGSSTSGGTVAADSGTTPVSATISGLTCGTTYHFRVTSTNSAATTSGNDATFTTSACVTQTITFGTAPTIIVGGTGTVSATGGGSGNPVVFTSQTPAVCTTSGANGATVTGVSTGTCTIAANQAGNAGYAPAPQVTQSFAITPNTATLTVSLLGNGGGSVNSDPSGIACTSGSSSGCSATFTVGAPVTLTALADWKSTFSGWGLPCSGTDSCIINLTGDGGIAAIFTKIPRVRIPGPTPVDFAALQDAYATVGDGDTLKMKSDTFFENLYLDRAVVVILDGGWDDTFTGIAGQTTLAGTLSIDLGTAIISNLVIQ